MANHVDPYVDGDAINTVVTTAATSTTPFGYSEAQANAIVTALNAIIEVLRDKGIIQE